MSIMKIAGAMLAVMLVTSPPLLAVYKWTDKNNVTHYDQFPPQGYQAEEIETKTGKAAKKPANTTPTEQSSRENRPSRESDDKPGDKEQEAAAERSAAIQKENCAKARQNLNILENNQRIRIQDKGEYRVLSEKERQKQIDSLQERIRTTCQQDAEQE